MTHPRFLSFVFCLTSLWACFPFPTDEEADDDDVGGIGGGTDSQCFSEPTPCTSFVEAASCRFQWGCEWSNHWNDCTGVSGEV